MAWYKFWGDDIDPVQPEVEEKLNPAQPMINEDQVSSREFTTQYEKYYEKLEVVNRGVNMIVDDVAEIPCTVGEHLSQEAVQKGVKKQKLDKLLNSQPNPFQDINTFRRNLITDYLIDGNIFIYFDGVYLYHLPASKVVIHGSESTYVSKYTFNEQINYKPKEIIHIKENSFYSIYRGVPRLKAALRTMRLLDSMRNFQDNFFDNGAVPGLVIKSPNTLSQKIKERLLTSWMARYNPKSGGKRPMILDGGLEVDALSNVDFRELDFQEATLASEKVILKALGVPPILLDSGNNANIRPNLRMYYLEAVLPIVKKINFAFERYFGYEINENTTEIIGLQPELNEQASYYSTLVNTGIITADEARCKLGYCDKGGEAGELRVPANIAGSAANPAEGGRPAEEED